MGSAKTIGEKMVAIKSLEYDIQNKILTTIKGSTKKSKEFLDGLIAQLYALKSARADIHRASLLEVFGLGKINNQYTSIRSSVKKYGQTLQIAGNSLQSMSSKFGKMGPMVSKLGAGMASMGLKFVPVIGWVITAVMLVKNLLDGIFNVFKQADIAAEKFRMTMGITREFTAGIDQSVRSIAINLAHVGVNFETAYQSVIAIAQTMGSMVPVTKGMTETISIFTAQLGISADKSAQVLKTFGMIARNTMTSQRNMLYFTSALSQAAGTNLGEVMSDIADFAQSNYRFMSKSVLEMAKASVEARRLGTSMASAAKSANSLLNFTASVNDEMEASVLVGRSIDLQRARSLSYARDIEGLNREILRLTKEFDFENMDPIQMQAFAKMLGKSEEELGKMIQAQREQQDLERRAANDPRLRAQLDRYNALKNANEAIAKASAEDYETKLKTQANQQRLIALQNTWNQLIQKLAEDFLPVVDDLLKSAIPALKVITKLAYALSQPLIGVLKILSGIVKILTFDFKEGFEMAVKGIGQSIAGIGTVWMKDLHEEWFKTSSPHKLGKDFVRGFELAAPMVENSLARPLSNAIKSYRAALEEGTSPMLGSRPLPPGIKDIKPIIPDRIQTISTTPVNETSMMKVVESINRLREDMLTGKLAANVYIDSQKLALATDRATRFRNGDGVNNATAF